MTAFANKCRKLIVAPRSFGPPKLPFAAGNEAAEYIWETYRSEMNTRRRMYGVDLGVGSYGWSHVDGFRNANVIATPGCRLTYQLKSHSCAVGGIRMWGKKVRSGRSGQRFRVSSYRTIQKVSELSSYQESSLREISCFHYGAGQLSLYGP